MLYVRGGRDPFLQLARVPMINDDILGLFFSFISFLFVGRVLGPVGGPGGSEFLSLVLPKGVDIRNIHLDGIQARHQGSSWV